MLDSLVLTSLLNCEKIISLLKEFEYNDDLDSLFDRKKDEEFTKSWLEQLLLSCTLTRETTNNNCNTK